MYMHACSLICVNVTRRWILKIFMWLRGYADWYVTSFITYNKTVFKSFFCRSHHTDNHCLFLVQPKKCPGGTEKVSPGTYLYSITTTKPNKSFLTEFSVQKRIYIWALSCDFQQCGILTSVDSDEPVQLPFKLRNSKWCSVSSLTLM